MIELPHATLDGQSDGGALAPGQWQGELEGLKVLNGHATSAPAARPCLGAQTGPAAIAHVLTPSSPMLSELRRQRDALRDQVKQAKGLLAGRGEALSALNGAGGLPGGGISVDVEVLPATIAALSVAGPSSRTLSRLEELRDALLDLVDEAKAGRAR